MPDQDALHRRQPHAAHLVGDLVHADVGINQDVQLALLDQISQGANVAEIGIGNVPVAVSLDMIAHGIMPLLQRKHLNLETLPVRAEYPVGHVVTDCLVAEIAGKIVLEKKNEELIF